MDGIIIFADNKVFDRDSFENQLFDKLRYESSLSILPVCSIECLEETIKTVSTFKALILDWNFDRDEYGDDLGGAELSARTPELFLENIELYSLIYVYSQNDIGEEIKQRLGIRFPNKIKFRTKNTDNISSDVESIRKDIKSFEDNNKHMEIPFVWSQAINRSVQKIFSELEQADPNWIKEIRDTAENDGGDPTSEVIDIFHHILNESLIQNVPLRRALNDYSCNAQGSAVENTAKLYRRIYYSSIYKEAPIMTGDIFKFNDDEFGILITPECDLSNKEDGIYEFLIINKSTSNTIQNKQKKKFQKDPKSVSTIFNNGVVSRHILISFPFEEHIYNELAVIEFCSAMRVYDKKQIHDKNFIERTHYKLNSPYIQQLRQRYIAFLGRYGVPAIPQSLRDYNLKSDNETYI
ncbi:MAG: hypothetical protein ACI3YG_02465 [Prevotella sp.]